MTNQLLKLLGVFTLLTGLGFGGCLAGCSTAEPLTADQQAAKQAQLESTLAALEKANFEGQVDLEIGGSPFGLNACTSWSLGPQVSTLGIHGRVDFTDIPRSSDPVDPRLEHAEPGP